MVSAAPRHRLVEAHGDLPLAAASPDGQHNRGIYIIGLFCRSIAKPSRSRVRHLATVQSSNRTSDYFSIMRTRNPNQLLPSAPSIIGR